MKKIYKIGLIKIFILLAFSAVANADANNSQITINKDFAVFFIGNSEYLIELYYSYPDITYTLIYQAEEEIYYGNLDFTLKIDSVHSDGEIKRIAIEKWHAPFIHKKDTVNKYEPQDFYGVQKFTILAGKYNATLEVIDENGKRNFEARFEIVVEPINSEKLGLSSIQIANNIIPKSFALQNSQSQFAEIFYKNQHYIYPNPLREISSDVPTLHLYSEIYSAKTASPKGIEVKYLIKNARNSVEFEHSKNKPSVADAMVETISIPLDAMQSGVYTVEIIIYSNDKKDSCKKSTKFYLINNNIPLSGGVFFTEDELFDMSEFATFGAERIELEFEQYQAIATKDEIRTWKKLSDTKAKQRFLYRFWFVRNPNPDNPFNAELAEFRERLKYVITYYSFGGNNNGWKSDRGQIYLKYGEPDYKENSMATPNQKAFEIWSYHAVEGGGQFCFVDSFGLNNHKLVHSTVRGHIANHNWRNLLSRSNNSEQMR